MVLEEYVLYNNGTHNLGQHDEHVLRIKKRRDSHKKHVLPKDTAYTY